MYNYYVLSCVTYNVFLGQKIDPLVEWFFEKNKPQDIYCFQEFVEDQIPKLDRYLKDNKLDYAFCPGFEWRGKTYGELTVFNKQKIKLLDTKTLALGGKGELTFVFIRNGLSLDTAIAKIAIDKTSLLTRFKYRDEEFVIANTHLVSDIHNSRKLKQLQLIVKEVENDKNVVILGDFNYPFGRGHFKLMLKSGFSTSFDKTNTFRLFPGMYYQNDFIFARNCEIKNAKIEKVRFSDHYPVFFDLEI